MSNLPQNDFPALSLTLAGIFGPVEAGGDEIGSSTENSSALGKSRSTEEIQNDEDDDEEENDDKRNKKRKTKYHRHTPQQIRVMEALFKESPHPDEKQRQELSKQLGLDPKQVKFWFQNRRTQIKAIQERHENSLLKSEIEKLRNESKALRTTNEGLSCPNCGFASPSRDPTTSTNEQRLWIENYRLKAEVERLQLTVDKYRRSNSSPDPPVNDKDNRSTPDLYTGVFNLQKSHIVDVVNQAMEELRKMATHGEPLWMRSYETGREILNYDEYTNLFCSNSNPIMQQNKSVEASRETGVIFVDLPLLVQSFMDVNQWTELFPCLVSKARTLDIISDGEGVQKDGAINLMFAEIQMLTPMIASREMYFVRHCRQLGPKQWGIVDVSIDKVENDMDASLQKCIKHPSGCIIEDQSTGHCKVTWIEHLECQKSRIHSLYLTMVNSGLAFGARHWVSTLQQQCEQRLFLDATNVPTKDSSGVTTLAGRKSLLKLAQRMTRSICRTLGASSYNSWNKYTSKTGEDIRLASRKNVNDPGEPLGMIVSAATSAWLPVSHNVLFDFLRDENRRKEWDVMSNGNPVQCTANLAKGKDRKNAVTVLSIKGKEQDVWVVQDSSRNAFESMLFYAPLDFNSLQSVMSGCDSSNTAVLASGFSILSDGIESRPSVISKEDMDGGSLVTIVFQMLISDSTTTKISKESIDSVNALISYTLQNIRKSLECAD